MTTPLETPAVVPGLAPNSLTVPAPLTSPAQTLPPTQYFTADQVEAIRQQEKDKLYQKLQKTEAQMTEFKAAVDQLKADKDARDAELEKQRKAAADAQRLEAESKLSAQQLIEAKQREFEEMQAKFRQDMELERAIMTKQQEVYRLQSFAQRRVAEEIAANTIIPDLVEYITGDTEGEIEAAINKAKEKTANIVKGAISLTPGIPGGVSPTGGPSGLLDTLSSPRPLTAEEIRNMPMDKFLEFRKQSGLDRAGNGQGLFG